MATSFWDSETEVARIPKDNRGEEIVVKKTVKSGRSYVDVRTWYPDRSGEMMPGKGLSIPMDVASDVAEAIEKATSDAD